MNRTERNADMNNNNDTQYDLAEGLVAAIVGGAGTIKIGVEVAADIVDELLAARKAIAETQELREACEQLRPYRVAIRAGEFDHEPTLADAILGVVAALGTVEQT